MITIKREVLKSNWASQGWVTAMVDQNDPEAKDNKADVGTKKEKKEN